jgi:soluble cytochrome b562
MTERDITDSWSRGRARKPDEIQGLSETQQFGESHSFGIPANGSNSKSVQRQTNNNSEGLSINNQSEKPISPDYIARKLPRWMQNWVVWLLILTLVPGGIAFMAVSMLLKLPAAPNCPEIFWPLASESVRLHCAQLAASKQTVTDLLQAIGLVKQLSKDHPLRGEADRFIERWSRDILQLADQSFQAGNLEEAIATARKIPEDLAAYQVVEEQVTKWETIWARAEKIYQETEAELRQRNWQSAFMLSAKLLRVDNKYWATTKYDELNQIIVTAREDGEKLAQAESLAKSSAPDKILEAIKIVGAIRPNSYVYQKAQELIPTFGRRMLDLAQASLDKRDADTALDIARQIPENTGLQTEVEDFISLGEAQRSAWLGNIAGLETAIAQAQQIEPTRAVYSKAQQLIARWQLEIEDVANLEKARTLASQGTITDLTAAIAQVQLIPRGNPRGTEAREEMTRWQAQVETIQDRPFLERAEQIALLDDITSLQAAIVEASQIRNGRALYPEARRRIRNWTAKIQRIQDQPYLDQARYLAQSGNLPAAISAAEQLASSGRALSGEAQQAINEWRGELRARENLQRARSTSLAGTPDALVEAIRLAQQVPQRNILRMDANIVIDQWSQQLLEIARSQGQSDMYKGIEIARLVPRGSSAYSAAQEQIRTWRQFLNPEPSPVPSPVPSPLPIETSSPIRGI